MDLTTHSRPTPHDGALPSRFAATVTQVRFPPIADIVLLDHQSHWHARKLPVFL